LQLVEKAGAPVWDSSAKAWFASANGQLVRLVGEGRLVVIADNVQGTDLDVHHGAGVAVSREPGHGIVLHHLDPAASARRTLLRGEFFFQPRFSPDGSRILLAESRPDGGHLWVMDLEGHRRDLGPGYGAIWHPDGRRVVFSHIRHDGERIAEGDLWVVEVDKGLRRRLRSTPGVAEIEPALSADGLCLAYVDALTGNLLVASFPELAEEAGPAAGCHDREVPR